MRRLPGKHHMASAKAVDGCFGNEVAPVAHKLRDMYYHAHYIHSHIAIFMLWRRRILYAARMPIRLCGIYWGCGQSRPRNRRSCHQGPGDGPENSADPGRPFHTPVWCLPGGVCRGLSKEGLEEIKPMVQELSSFADFSLRLFRDVVLGNPAYVDIILNGPIPSTSNIWPGG